MTIPYYVVKNGRAYWSPLTGVWRPLAAEEIRPRALGPAGPAAEAQAFALYQLLLRLKGDDVSSKPAPAAGRPESGPIPYYEVVRGRAFWRPRRAPACPELRPRALGPAGPETEAQARALYQLLLIIKRDGVPPPPPPPASKYPIGSIGEAWEEYRLTLPWRNKSPRTREEWNRIWTLRSRAQAGAPRIDVGLERIFGHCDPKTITMPRISQWRELVEKHVSPREAHRAIKIWRALWTVMSSMKYCGSETDPSLGFANTEAPPRDRFWQPWEIARIAKRAWRDGYHGLAAALAVMWDGMMSPVDCRTLTPRQRLTQGRDVGFSINRAKTDAAAIAPLTRRSQRVLEAYMATLKTIPLDEPIFRTRSGGPYLWNRMSQDFRDLRNLVFPGDDRTMADIRRTGAREAAAGQADPKGLADNMGNSINQSRKLQRTYQGPQLATVTPILAARRRGRRAQSGTQSETR